MAVQSDQIFGTVRALFLGLAQEEAKHKLKLETEYDEYILTEN
jgi:hypothetical protein